MVPEPDEKGSIARPQHVVEELLKVLVPRQFFGFTISTSMVIARSSPTTAAG